jgi:lysophospholipase L1-like esterase
MKKFQILIFGASSTHGNWDEFGGWANRIRLAVIKKILDAPNLYHGHVFNLGVPGNTTGDLLKRMDREINTRLFYPDTIIIISIGTNDSRVITEGNKPIVTEEQLKMNWNKLIKVAKKYTDSVISVGLSPVNEKHTNPWDKQYSYINERITLFNSVIKTCSTVYDVPFVDVFSSFSQQDYTELLSDGLHPNTHGHKKIFDLTQPYIDVVLR